MDILGIGGWELVAIFIIMLVVAGPQRMIRWSYTMGQYIGKLRNMWREMATQLQKEIDAAGIDVKVPTQPPRPGSIQRQVRQSINKAVTPIKDPLNAVKAEIDSTNKALKQATSNTKEAPAPAQEAAPAAPIEPVSSGFGAWSSAGQTDNAQQAEQNSGQ